MMIADMITPKLVWLGIVIAVLLPVTVVVMTSAQPVEKCVSAKDRDHIKEMYLDAFDQAFKAQVVHLFDIWLKDYSPEPKRAASGMINAINAYQRAKAMQWNPPVCTE